RSGNRLHAIVGEGQLGDSSRGRVGGGRDGDKVGGRQQDVDGAAGHFAEQAGVQVVREVHHESSARAAGHSHAASRGQAGDRAQVGLELGGCGGRVEAERLTGGGRLSAVVRQGHHAVGLRERQNGRVGWEVRGDRR